ncbi:hypothetical protein [Azospirillum formosense]|uniref:hypothetical protein n=1 Tax=Azospirillum formosense TaxID=861533 RepID=UPI001B3BE3D9|nr:hypothetical protein [Azospirillum formosense]
MAFFPFITFAVLDRLVGPMEGLIAGALISAALLLRDWVRPGKKPKILEVGTGVLFGGLALYTMAGGPTQSIIGVRLLVDAGLLLIVLHRPFTLQYAREHVAPDLWDSPDFIRTNYVITGAWALAFFVLVIADLALLYIPWLPPPVQHNRNHSRSRQSDQIHILVSGTPAAGRWDLNRQAAGMS